GDYVDDPSRGPRLLPRSGVRSRLGGGPGRARRRLPRLGPGTLAPVVLPPAAPPRAGPRRAGGMVPEQLRELKLPAAVRRLMSGAGPAPGLTLDFFGVRVRLHLEAGDVADARFFFGAHGPGDDLPLDGGCRPDVDVWLWGDGGFYRSLLAKDEARKMVVIAERGETPRLAADFRSWSGTP